MFAFKRIIFYYWKYQRFRFKKIKKRGKFIIIYRNKVKEEISKLIALEKCKIKILFYVANDLHLAEFNSDGIYLSSFTKSFKPLNLKRCKFNIMGAHDVREII